MEDGRPWRDGPPAAEAARWGYSAGARGRDRDRACRPLGQTDSVRMTAPAKDGLDARMSSRPLLHGGPPVASHGPGGQGVGRASSPPCTPRLSDLREALQRRDHLSRRVEARPSRDGPGSSADPVSAGRRRPHPRRTNPPEPSAKTDSSASSPTRLCITPSWGGSATTSSIERLPVTPAYDGPGATGAITGYRSCKKRPAPLASGRATVNGLYVCDVATRLESGSRRQRSRYRRRHGSHRRGGGSTAR
jgi:hypothetical protein